jgi:hypothetical protein
VAIITLVGTLAGLAGALGVGRAARSMLFQMTGADPAVLALSAVALALVALRRRHPRVTSGSDEGVEIRIACREDPSWHCAPTCEATLGALDHSAPSSTLLSHAWNLLPNLIRIACRLTTAQVASRRAFPRSREVE